MHLCADVLPPDRSGVIGLPFHALREARIWALNIEIG